MAKYVVWHPSFSPEEFNFIENAFEQALEWIREMKGYGLKRGNTVRITREDIPHPVTVVIIRGFRIE